MTPTRPIIEVDEARGIVKITPVAPAEYIELHLEDLPMLETLKRAFEVATDKVWFARAGFAMRLLGKPRWVGIQEELDFLRPFTGNPSPNKATLKEWADL